MLKKILTSVIVCMIAVSFAGCSSDNKTGSDNSSVTENSQTECTKVIIKNNEIELSDEVIQKVSDFYEKTDKKQKLNVKLDLITEITVEFSDGSSLIFGSDKASIILYKKSSEDTGKFIEISEDFNNYVRSLNEE